MATLDTIMHSASSECTKPKYSNLISTQPQDYGWISAFVAIFFIPFLRILRFFESVYPSSSTITKQILTTPAPQPRTSATPKTNPGTSANQSLRKWLDRPIKQQHLSYDYSGYKDIFETYCLVGIYGGHARLCASLILKTADKHQHIAPIKDSLRSIIDSTERSPKFTRLMKNIMPFLGHIVDSPTDVVVDFLTFLAQDFVNRPIFWFLGFIHSRLRSENTSALELERTLGAFCLFFREGSSLNALLAKEHWPQDKWLHNAILTMLQYTAVERLFVETTFDEAPDTCAQTQGLEIFLKDDMDVTFRRFASRSTPTCDRIYRDRLLWDITSCFANEYIEFGWKDETLERAIWVFEYGKPFLSSRVYDRLKMHMESGQCHNLDLTGVSGLHLLALSLAGIVNMEGRDASLFRLTAEPYAAVKVHCHVPKVSVHDLVQLGLCRMIREGVYMMGSIPGYKKSPSFKAVPVGDRIMLVQSDVSKEFKAKPQQTIR